MIATKSGDKIGCIAAGGGGGAGKRREMS